MSAGFFEQLGIPEPDVNLEVGSGTQAEQSAAIMVRYEKVLLEQSSDLCLVVGDVNSTMACSIAARTLVSVGTDRMLVEFGKAGWIDKARQPPDTVRMVLEKVRTDGLAATLEAVKNKLDQPLTLGYCNVGVVAGLGAGVEGFAVGDRVASNGRHAEIRAGFAHVRSGLEYAIALY